MYPGTIANTLPHSTAARAGLLPGDCVWALNDQPLRDVIDVQIYAGELELTFQIERNGQLMDICVERQYGEALGLEFTAEIFDDKLRVCQNHCDFCFVDQLAPNLRSPLYIKDDDYRLSFLHGNYITLSNLTAADWQRIEEQFLSPLYVSVHATEAAVRVGLMHNPRAGDIMAQLTRLADMSIKMHTQAVLAPGRNDGAHLDRTIADLATLHPYVADFTVVPVGLTRWQHADLRPYTDTKAGKVLAQIRAWQAQLRADLGLNFVYPSDEWFLRAGVPVPPLAEYDELLPALIENGVGMVRLFLDSEADLFAQLASLGGPRQTWVTGTLFAPTLHKSASRFMQQSGLTVEVAAVPNRTFGETVTVAGLLTVDDIIAQLQTLPPSDVIVLPATIFRGPDGLSLDNRPPTAIAEAIGGCIYLAQTQKFSQQIPKTEAQS